MNLKCSCGIKEFYNLSKFNNSLDDICFLCQNSFNETKVIQELLYKIHETGLCEFAWTLRFLEYAEKYYELCKNVRSIHDFDKLPNDMKEFFLRILAKYKPYQITYDVSIYTYLLKIKFKISQIVSILKTYIDKSDYENANFCIRNIENEIKAAKPFFIKENPMKIIFNEEFAKIFRILCLTLKSISQQYKFQISNSPYKAISLQKIWKHMITKIKSENESPVSQIFVYSIFEPNNQVKIPLIKLRRFGLEFIRFSCLYIFGGMKITENYKSAILSNETFSYNLLQIPPLNTIINANMNKPTYKIISCTVGNYMIFSVGLTRSSLENEVTCEMYNINKNSWTIQSEPVHLISILFLVPVDNRFIYCMTNTNKTLSLDITDIESGWITHTLDFNFQNIHLAMQVSYNQIMIFSMFNENSGIYNTKTLKLNKPHFSGPNFTHYATVGGKLIPYIHSSECPMCYTLYYANLMKAEKINDTPCYLSSHNTSRDEIIQNENIDIEEQKLYSEYIFNIPPELAFNENEDYKIMDLYEKIEDDKYKKLKTHKKLNKHNKNDDFD